MKISIIFFILIAFTIIFGTHFLVYISWVRFFNIENIFYKRLLLILLAILSISFILSSVLSRYGSNIVFKAYYTLSSAWSGLLIYLLLSALATIIITFVANKFGFGIQTVAVYSTLLAISIIFAIYGAIVSLAPKITDITVAIKDLPAAWEDRAIVQVSDLHLGLIYNGWFADKIIDQVNTLNADMVVLTGDYLDGTCPKLDKLTEPLNRLNAKNVFYISGNHETYIGMDKVRDVLKENKAVLLEDKTVEIDGLNIAGAAYPERGTSNDLPAFLDTIDQTKPSILLYHEPRFIQIAKDKGIDLQLSGHTHKGQFWPFGYITRLIYGKYHFGLHTEGDYSIYTSNGTGTWGPPNRLFNRGEIVRITLKRKNN